MSPEALTELLLEYRYWILVPLSLIEGPVVAFVAGTLAAAGFFSLSILAIFFFVRDVGIDLIYYAIGHFGGRTEFAKRMLHKLGVTDHHVDRVHALWSNRPGTTMLLGKLSYGIAAAFIVVAGMVRMPLSKFVGYGSLVAVLQYGTLIALGYFFGASFGVSIGNAIELTQYVLLAASLGLIGYYFISFRARKKFLAEEIH